MLVFDLHTPLADTSESRASITYVITFQSRSLGTQTRRSTSTRLFIAAAFNTRGRVESVVHYLEQRSCSFHPQAHTKRRNAQ